MSTEIGQCLNECSRSARWAGRIGLVLESPELVFEISECLGRIGANIAFRTTAGASALEVASLVEREQADLVLVELARVKESTSAQWIGAVRAGLETPLIAALDLKADPAVMIDAVRAGANEFLSLPAAPGIYEALDRLTMVLESRRAASRARGRMAGILSAKGGCGATTVACHLAAALRAAGGTPTGTASGRAENRVLVADLDAQSSAAHRVLRVKPTRRAGDAFAGVRQLNAACWPDYASAAGENLDLLAGWETGSGDGPPLSEPWRIEGLFRFLSRNYGWVLADLGRNLNPAGWAFLQNLDELFVVTVPEVPALYQTRSMLQTLASRGFEKTRVHLILNRNNKGPRDFWIESIRKMFEMDVIAVIPDDQPTLDRLPRDRFEFPAGSPFGRAVGKLAAQLTAEHVTAAHPAKGSAHSASNDTQAGRGRKEAGRKIQ